MERNVEISMLNQIYGKLLTKKQYEIIDDYYNHDLSLSEIAENNEITRQAVRDILKKGEKKLYEYEEKLKDKKKTEEQEKVINEIVQELKEIAPKCKDKEITNILGKIEKKLKALI